MGSIVALEGTAIENGLRVCAGVPKAGEEEGIGFKVEDTGAGAGVLGGNIEATWGLLCFCILSDEPILFRNPEVLAVFYKHRLVKFAICCISGYKPWLNRSIGLKPS